MRRKELLSNILGLITGVAFTVESLDLGLGHLRRPGMGFMPFLVGMSLSLISFYSLIRSLWIRNREIARVKDIFFARASLNVVTIVAVLAVYTVILPWLGYLPSTLLMLVVLFKASGVPKWYFVLMAALLTTGFSYLVFDFCLGVRFPKGILEL